MTAQEPVQPVPVSDIDQQTREIVARTRQLQVWTAFLVILFILLFGAGTGYLLVQEQGQANTTSQQAAVTACQVRYNQAYAKAQTIRTGLTDASNAATETLIASVFTFKPGETQAQSTARLLRAYSVYKAAQAHITLERKEHPVPAAPNCTPD